MIQNSLELDIPKKGSIINSLISTGKEEKLVCLSTTRKRSIGSIEMKCVFAFPMNGLIGMIVF